MTFIIWKEMWFFFAVCWSGMHVNGAISSNETDHQPVSGYGFEVLQARLDYIQYKLLEMSVEMKEHTEAINLNREQQETLFGSLVWAISRLDQAVAVNLTSLQASSQKILSQQTICANHNLLRLEVSRIVPKMPQAVQSALGVGGLLPKAPLLSCADEPTKVSGKYLMQIDESLEPIAVSCEQRKFGGGWLVFQHRFDGSENFYRNWSDYRDGFGSVEREFWLGLEQLHLLTSRREYELLIELEDFFGRSAYARYSKFAIGSETEKYSLKQLGNWNGTAPDSLTYLKGMAFSTPDRDNDKDSRSCAVACQGAWWYKDCTYSNLNGLRLNKTDDTTNFWHGFTNSLNGLAYTRMMIRELQN